MNFVRELPPYPYCALAKAKRFSFSKPITILDQIGGLFFSDVQGPFKVESLEGSVNKIATIEAKTRFLWMNVASSKKAGGVLEQWLKDTIPWMRAQHGLKGFKSQNDNGEFNREACKDLVAASGGELITNCLHSPETMSIIELSSWRAIGEMTTVMLLLCNLVENFWEEATLYEVVIYNRVSPA